MLFGQDENHNLQPRELPQEDSGLSASDKGIDPHISLNNPLQRFIEATKIIRGELLRQGPYKDAATSYNPSYQMAFIKRFNEMVPSTEIQAFTTEFHRFLQTRADLLAKYFPARVESIRESLKRSYSGIHSKMFLRVTTRSRSGQIGIQKTPTDRIGFIHEGKMEELLREEGSIYLPQFSNEPSDYHNVTIKSGVNVIEFYGTPKKGKARIEGPVHIFITRDKRSERDEDKSLDAILLTRRFHHDQISAHEIMRDSERVYEAIKEIHQLSITDAMPFNLVPRPSMNRETDNNQYAELIKRIQSKPYLVDLIKKINPLFPLMIELSPRYNSSNFKSVLRQAEIAAGRLLSKSVDDYPFEYRDYLKKLALVGIWVDHSIEQVNMETILQDKASYDIYIGPVGHNAHYDNERERWGKERRIARNVDLIVPDLKRRLHPAFSFVPIDNSGKRRS